MARDTCQRLFRRQRNSVQAMFSISSKDVQGEVPGLLSVDTAMGTPCWRSKAIAVVGLAQKVEGAGQQHGTVPAAAMACALRVTTIR